MLPNDRLPPSDTGLVLAPPTAAKGGLLRRLLAFLGVQGAARPEERAVVSPSDDPVRQILAVPRGVARLDAFQRTLAGLTPGSHGHRGVALAFHRELSTLSSRAEVDLALLGDRVTACAEALAAADEGEKAAHLLSRVGLGQRAAELFVAAGAVDALEALHEAEERAPSAAQLAHRRAETLLATHRREEALAALQEAVRLWPAGQAYRDAAERLRQRLPSHRLALGISSEGQPAQRLIVETRWPLRIGRDETCALRLGDPRVSRQHVELSLRGPAVHVSNLSGRGCVLVAGEDLPPGGAGCPLPPQGDLVLAGVPLRFQRDEGGLWLEFPDAPPRGEGEGGGPQRLWVPFQPDAPFPLPLGSAHPDLRLQRTEAGAFRLRPLAGMHLGTERLSVPLLLAFGDELSLPGGERVQILGARPARHPPRPKKTGP